MPKKSSQKSKPLGGKIKQARLEKGLSLDGIANDTGCAISTLKAIESGKEMPPVGLLIQIARALHLDSGFFLSDGDELENRSDAYNKRSENYAYETLTPDAENKHLKAFRIKIEAKSTHEGVGYRHDGEEFIYMLSGRVEIKVGEHVNKLREGQSLHFNSGIQHQIVNKGIHEAEALVVIYSP